MSGKPEPVETDQKVGQHGGPNVYNAPPPPEPEDVYIEPVVAQTGGETTVRNER